ncbi:serine hydrolase domain-containing protein [Ornithinimicrobium pratense]|nr:serine hydrolase domain-containing protein [Ornithinimicrobium pratense]
MTKTLQELVDEQVAAHPVPGVAVGMVLDGEVTYATHGVTNIENPLDVDDKTLFQFGSTGKTYTATAIMMLADQGRVDLEAPVRDYLPEFKVADEQAAATVRVKNLLNHTAGWSGDFLGTPERGDRALEDFVEHMAKLKQDFPVGAGMSYNNSALSVAGRIIEVVTGKPFDQAMTEMVLQPLGMESTFFFAEDVITRRFAVGHLQDEETKEFSVARPWALPRGGGPAGGMSAPITDQVTWMKFHLGDGTAQDGTRILPQETLDLMKVPAIRTPGSTLGDAIGISWLIQDVDGTQVVGHGGTTIGQQSALELVPSRGFGIAVLTNSSGGGDLHRAIVHAATAEYLGLQWPKLKATDRPTEALTEYEGVYRNISLVSTVTTTKEGLQIDSVPTQDFLDMVGAPAEAFESPPTPIKMVDEEGDLFVVIEDGSPGYRGSFQRGEDGQVTGMHFGGRLTLRDPA